jgi:hypothetical protein
MFRENQNTHLKLNFFFRKSSLLFDNVEMYGTAGKAAVRNIRVIRNMRFGYCVTQDKKTHSEFVILIAFPRQQWLYKRAPVPCYMYIVPLVTVNIFVAVAKAKIFSTLCLQVSRDTNNKFQFAFKCNPQPPDIQNILFPHIIT